MGYQRAKWHSKLTYRQTCWKCSTTFTYRDDVLGFRYWFPDGFVYCPACKATVRHQESYAIDELAERIARSVKKPPFCTHCGKRAITADDLFCTACGKKLDK